MNTLITRLRKLKIELIQVNGKLTINAPAGVVTPELLNEIRENKDLLLAYMQNATEKDNFSLLPNAPLRTHYRLSSAQMRLYFLYEFSRDSLAYNITQVLKIEGALDRERLQKAFNLLMARHESLRTSFEVIDGEPVQKIGKASDIGITSFDGNDEGIPAIVEKFIRPFDLARAPLIRVGLIGEGPRTNTLVVDVHHIIADGASLEILIKECMALYNDQELPELPIQYKDYAEWQWTERQSTRKREQRDFWLNEFEGGNTPLELPADLPRPAIRGYAGSVARFALDKKETERLKRLAEREGCTLFMVILAIYNIFLSKLSNGEDITVGIPAAGRYAGTQDVVGMFVNTLPVRSHPGGALSFREFLQQVKERVISCFDNQSFPFEELLDELKVERDASRNPLFDVMFVFQPFERAEHGPAGLTITTCDHDQTVAKFDLTLSTTELEDHLALYFEYSVELFKRPTVDRLIGYFKKVVSAVVSDADTKISAIEIISDEENQLLLHDLNQTRADYPKTETIMSLFDQQVLRTPDPMAYRWKNRSVSYAELKKMSDKIAGYLRVVKGLQTGDLVGLMLEREEYLIPVIFGILKAGGAYVPIDPHYPAERVNSILSDSGLQLLITRSKYKKEGIQQVSVLIDLDEEMEAILAAGPEPPATAVGSDELAYVLYTSGSTGKPKGVMIEHHAVVNRIGWMQKQYPLRSGDVILQKTPVSFDVSVWELFWWSITGASLCLLDPDEEKDPEAIIGAIRNNGVTTLHFVPPMLGIFLSVLKEDAHYTALRSLRLVFASGEALTPALVRVFGRTLHQHSGTRLINLYGPTEATVDVSFYECTFRDEQYSVPIGRPIDNIKLYVLNKDRQLSPIGVQGELCIAGVGLARGYLNNKAYTEERFVQYPCTGMERLYRTGDLTKRNPDGNIEFLGRMDQQVKIRGFRIELGEIENKLAEHDQINEVVALVKESTGMKFLVAYYVSPKEIKAGALRTFLSGKLPAYMVPAHYVHLQGFPLTANGKLNRKALPAPEIDTGDRIAVPANETEARLVGLWSDVLDLGKDKISVDRNFFELGGNSLRIIRLHAYLKDSLAWNISIADMFRHPTISSLVNFVHAKETTEVQYDREAEDEVALMQDKFSILSQD